MAGNHNTLKTNPFASLVTPLVDYFNQPAKRYNPFAALLVGNALVTASQRWGAKLTSDGATSRGVDPCGPDGGFDLPCDKFADSYTGNLLNGARLNKMDGDLSIYYNLVKKLKAIGTGDLPNRWVDFNYAVDYYFANVDMIEYFYGDNIKRSSDSPLCCDVDSPGIPCRPCDNLIDYSIGVFRHPHRNNGAGFYVEDFVEGRDVGSNVTTITLHKIGSNEGQPNAYFIMWASATDRYIVWWPSGGLAVPPAVPPMLGINDFYIQVNASFLNTAEEVQQLTIDAVNAIDLGTLFTATPGQTINPGPDELREVIITTIPTGAHPDSTFNLSTINTLFWTGSFTAADQGAAYEFGFSYDNLTLANSSTLFGKTFIIYALNGDAYVFYYTDGVVTANAEPCDVAGNNVPCYEPGAISVTAIDLVAARATTLAQLYDETYTVIAATVPGVTYDSGRGSIGTITYDSVGVVTPPNSGTMLPGVNYSFSSKIWGSDLTELASDVDSDEKYAEYWNTSLVEHEKTLGFDYPYLGGVVVATGRSGIVCGSGCASVNQRPMVYFGQGASGGPLIVCRDCSILSGAGTFRTVPGPYKTPLAEYNTPAFSFNIPVNTKSQYSVKDVDANL